MWGGIGEEEKERKIMIEVDYFFLRLKWVVKIKVFKIKFLMWRILGDEVRFWCIEIYIYKWGWKELIFSRELKKLKRVDGEGGRIFRFYIFDIVNLVL